MSKILVKGNIQNLNVGINGSQTIKILHTAMSTGSVDQQEM